MAVPEWLLLLGQPWIPACSALCSYLTWRHLSLRHLPQAQLLAMSLKTGKLCQKVHWTALLSYVEYFATCPMVFGTFCHFEYCKDPSFSGGTSLYLLYSSQKEPLTTTSGNDHAICYWMSVGVKHDSQLSKIIDVVFQLIKDGAYFCY